VELEGLTHLRSGKVRDLYAGDGDQLLLVASDRVSTYDVVHPTPIPDKGKVLTGVSAFWFDHLKDVVGNHLISTDVADFPPAAQPTPRCSAAARCCVARSRSSRSSASCAATSSGPAGRSTSGTGRSAGSCCRTGWSRPTKLPEPIFTPATKAEQGEHDENVSFEVMADALGSELANQLRDVSLELYSRGARWPPSGGSSSPTPSSSSASSTARSCWPTRS
jgi:phosphoribosylaminoimidazole-succinocarboxamide synthase